MLLTEIGLYGCLKAAGMIAALIFIIRTAVSRSRNDSVAWYDRAIRVGGGIILILFVLTMIAYVMFQQKP